MLRFIRIPKTGSDSLINVLGRKYEVGHHHTLTSVASKNRDGQFFAAFVRNPWDRLVSKWLQIKGEDDDDDKNPNVVIANQYKSFNDFAQDINNIPISKEHKPTMGHMTWVLLPCCHWLYDEHDTLDEIDFIGRFENLYTDYVLLCEKVGLQSINKLPHNNKTSGRRHYSCYYTSDKAVQAVADFAKDDITHFKYEFIYSCE